MVVFREIEIARFALVALPSFHIRFAGAGSSGRITARRVGERASHLTAAVLATSRAKFEESVEALITEFASYAWLTLTLAFFVALRGQ